MFGFAIVLVAVVGVCAGEGYQRPTEGYGTRSYATRSGQNNYGNEDGSRYGGYQYGYNYAYLFRNLDDQLERIDTYLNNLETREANQVYRLNRLTQSANLNLDFRNNFENTVSEEIQFHQDQQDKRCDALEEAIAQIRLIRERVLNLTVDAEAIRTNLEDEVFPVNKQIASDIRHLQHEDILRSNRITETQGRADAVNERIDVLIAKAWDNTRTILVLFRDIKAGIKSVNRERFYSIHGVLLPPGSGDLDFGTPFDGTPHFAQTVLTGFHLVRDHYYDYGYPSLYFGIITDLWNSRVDVESVDMSTGGWTAKAVSLSGDYIYFDSNTLVLQSKTT